MADLWDYVVQTTHPGTIQVEGDTATGRAYIAEFGRLREGSSHLNYAVYHDPHQRTPPRVEVRRPPLRDQVRRHHSTGGLGAARAGGHPLTHCEEC